MAQSKIDVGHYRELLNNAKEKADRDKEALKKATRYGVSYGVLLEPLL